jgi:putative ABC transport system permease protein
MPWTSRLHNLFRQSKVNADLDEELRSHIEEAIQQGRSPEDARRAFGSPLRHREQSRDFKLLPALDALASDILFGWRQIAKHRIANAAAIFSLALSIGAATAAYRLVDALMWRTLPVAHPERLFFLAPTTPHAMVRPIFQTATITRHF